ncbi:MAG TPA: HigA family addiction module antitoxin [Nevskiaceae bacterium]|nr:HigA family addiction module antitoxin [Nevskiaceae bacterium]
MTEYTAQRAPDRAPTHPGAILRDDVLPALHLSIAEAARRLHVSRQTLTELIAERQAFTPAMALRVGKLAGNGGAFWLHMQGEHDLWQTGRDMAEELQTIKRATA